VSGYWTQQSHTASVPDVTAPVCMSTGWYDIFLPWHLHASGLLGRAAPDGGGTRYTYDPGDPTPAVGGPGLTPDSAPADNRAHELRSDVAVFRSAPLEAAVVIAHRSS
jgi:predicted acyl esterase